MRGFSTTLHSSNDLASSPHEISHDDCGGRAPSSAIVHRARPSVLDRPGNARNQRDRCMKRLKVGRDRSWWMGSREENRRRCKNALVGNRHGRLTSVHPVGHPAAKGDGSPCTRRLASNRGILCGCRCIRDAAASCCCSASPPFLCRGSRGRGGFRSVIILTRNICWAAVTALPRSSPGNRHPRP